MKTAKGKDDAVGVNIITSKKYTEKEKRHIEQGLKKEIDPNKTNLSKTSLLVYNLTTKNIKNNEPLKNTDLEKTNKTIDKKHHIELVAFVFKGKRAKNNNRTMAREIKKR